MFMAKVDADKRRAMGAILSRSFTLANPPLTAIETVALERLKLISFEGRVATQDEIRDSVGCTSGGVATGIVNRLVEKGYVEHVVGRLQRALWLRIVETGAVTAEPRSKAPHWRDRRENVQAPAIHQIASRDKSLADMIEAKARAFGKPIAEFLMDCVYAGFFEICDEQ